MTEGKGSFAVPFSRRDGRRIWVAGSFNEVSDPDNGRRMVVGTFRDITAEHYAVQREAALAAMGLVLSRAGSAVQVLHETLGELRRLWRARNVTAATWTGTDQVTVASTESARTWEALPAEAHGRPDRPAGPTRADADVRRARRSRHPARASGGHPGDLAGARPRPRAQHRGPDSAQPGLRLPRPGAAPRLPDGPAARDGPRPATRDPRPAPAARGVRRPLRARHPPARGRRRLVRHRRTARRADRHHGRRLRRARPAGGHGHGPAPQRLPGAAAARCERRSGPDGHGQVRVLRSRGRVRHGLLRHP